MTVRFEQAFVDCVGIVRKHRGQLLRGATKIVLVRDLFGRIHLALKDLPQGLDLEPALRELANAGGRFWSEQILEASAMVAPEQVFESVDAFEIDRDQEIWGLERLVVGAEWHRGPLQNREPRPPRATLYGLKGGVGRSTAVCVWARHLAMKGKRVLVVDLDLESPGISSLLLPREVAPDYGIVDWFVETAVRDTDPELVVSMVATSPLAVGTPGEILVAPCGGSLGDDYLPKLSRAYLELPGPKPVGFGERIAELVDCLEEQHQPDVVLLDSRAGLHDLAGVATTRLDAMTFLFAAGTRQTWDGYRILLRSWAKYPAVAQNVRDRVRIVAAQVPETERIPYLARLRQDAYDVFSDTLYEEAGPEDLDAFNFDINANDAPHDPLKIYWSRPLQDWEPTHSAVTPEQLDAAFADFLQRASELVLPDPEDEVELG